MDKTKISPRESFKALVNYHTAVTNYRPTLRMRFGLWCDMRVQAVADYLRKRKEW